MYSDCMLETGRKYMVDERRGTAIVRSRRRGRLQLIVCCTQRLLLQSRTGAWGPWYEEIAWRCSAWDCRPWRAVPHGCDITQQTPTDKSRFCTRVILRLAKVLDMPDVIDRAASHHAASRNHLFLGRNRLRPKPPQINTTDSSKDAGGAKFSSCSIFLFR
ncbi:hypothetical protein CC86DRAFT_44026 [Ophiobolus disseminans]|uniref:Uncharacterized protein n=1 Tax=Ophiobolus disseminans TaxID=1469910 RepID=A0A6A6ZXU1_9PLEO|nr:hypothetical protein CC86DRAFT_44026 [Ophiobolus disseminans]